MAKELFKKFVREEESGLFHVTQKTKEQYREEYRDLIHMDPRFLEQEEETTHRRK